MAPVPDSVPDDHPVRSAVECEAAATTGGPGWRRVRRLRASSTTGGCQRPPSTARGLATCGGGSGSSWTRHGPLIGRRRLAHRNSLGSPDDPGLTKDARDLELPPWNKGRYSTAVGRAVHGVLQSVDLATVEGLDDAVAAQTLAEGVTEHADVVAALAPSAMGSDVVQRAAARPHWRETYVGSVVGDRVLEGYIDLAYRHDDGGLVVVDYRTDTVPAAALDRRVAFH